MYLRVTGIVLLDSFLLDIANDGISHESKWDHHYPRHLKVRRQFAVGKSEEDKTKTHTARSKELKRPISLALY